MRHEGGAPSNNLIKDAPHRATVFVGPTLKSLFQIIGLENKDFISLYCEIRFDSVACYFLFLLI